MTGPSGSRDSGGWPGHNRCYVYDRAGSVIALCGACEKPWPCVYERAARRKASA